MTKLHPSIVITRKPVGMIEVRVDGEFYVAHTHENVVNAYSVSVSNKLWEIEVSERPAKPRPQRIWDESI